MQHSRSADNENKKVGKMIFECVTKFLCDEDICDELTATKLPCDEDTSNLFLLTFVALLNFNQFSFYISFININQNKCILKSFCLLYFETINSKLLEQLSQAWLF